MSTEPTEGDFLEGIDPVTERQQRDLSDAEFEGFDPHDPRISIADLDSPEKIEAAAAALRESLGLPEPLMCDDQPYAKFYYGRRPPMAMWNRDRMARELIRAGQGNKVPMGVKHEMQARKAKLS